MKALRFLRDVSIRRKLNFTVCLILMLALTIVCAGILTFDRSSFKSLTTRNLETLTEVTAARTRAEGARREGQPAAAADSENHLTGQLRTLFAVAEAYPELKSLYPLEPPSVAFARVEAVASSMDGWSACERSAPRELHCEASTPLMGFVDDVWITVEPGLMAFLLPGHGSAVANLRKARHPCLEQADEVVHASGPHLEVGQRVHANRGSHARLDGLVEDAHGHRAERLEELRAAPWSQLRDLLLAGLPGHVVLRALVKRAEGREVFEGPQLLHLREPVRVAAEGADQPPTQLACQGDSFLPRQLDVGIDRLGARGIEIHRLVENDHTQLPCRWRRPARVSAELITPLGRG